jgi:Tfp pilus assembly PilM family ATPase
MADMPSGKKNQGKQRPSVGLDIGSYSLKVIELSSESGLP